MPVKSVKRYDDAWNEFCKYHKLTETDLNNEPSEELMLQYFDHLKKTKAYASSTIWSVYSMINHKFQLVYGKKLQVYPRITMLLKSFEAGYVRKTASIFSKDEIKRFLTTAPDSGEFIHIKAAVALGFCGGLRCADMVAINTDDLEFNEVTGMWVKYTVSKQRGECISNKFNVPLEYCEFLERYDHKLHEFQVAEGRLFKAYRTRKDGSGYYTKQHMGSHQLCKFTIKMAEFLSLRNPSTYTGHALRRSCANILAEAGASTSQLKKHFNWKSENTSLKYVDNTTSGKMSLSNMLKSNDSLPTSKPSTCEPISKVVNLEKCQNIIINL